ncbi:MAG: hypothetical protein AB8F95_15685 [Bacteroidia bacterium]
MLILRRDLQTHSKSMLIGLGAMMALYAFIMIVLPRLNSSASPKPISESFHVGGYLIALFLGGSWFASGIWSDLNDTQKRQHFLTIPASNLEKYLSKWLISGPVFLIGLTVIYWLFSIAVNGLASVYPGVEYDSFTLKDLQIGMMLPYYLMLHPFFLAAGIWFGRFAFLKGLLVYMVFQLLLIGFIVFLTSVLFDGLEGRLEDVTSIQFFDYADILNNMNFWIGVASGIFFGCLGYIRLTERGA